MSKVIRWVLVLGAMAVLAGPVRAQNTLLGRSTYDKVLPAFMGQNTNAPTIIEGLNANRGSSKFSNDILPDSLTGKTFVGLFTGTNRFAIQMWDTNAAAFQTFEFVLQGNFPMTSNNVSRVGVPETNSFKVMNNWRLQSNGVYQAGIPVAKGTGYGEVIPGKTGTNRIDVLHEYTSTISHWVTFKEGVMTAAQ